MEGMMLNGTALVLVVILMIGLVVVLYMMGNIILNAPNQSSTIGLSTLNTTTATTSIPNINVTTITIPQNSNGSFGPGIPYTSNQVIEYTLKLINSERSQDGLQNVTLSNITSAQQHSQSMIAFDYFSHWDPFGLKPYMRYTLLGGTESVDENVAYNEQLNESCLGPVCDIHPINVTDAIYNMEYEMLYNDSACCDNGHRMNILDPNHNEVSLGIAYNQTSVYLTEDFVNYYIKWLNATPIVSGENVSLEGMTDYNTNFSFVQVNYDPTPANMTKAQLGATKSYDPGTAIAGIAYGPYYYENVQTVYASSYTTRKDYFKTTFSLSSLIKSYGAGVYTLNIYLTNSTGGKFLGTTYSIFIGQNGLPYTPGNV